MSGQPNFGVLLERFFTQRLMQQRRASAHTIASYRDTFKMMLQFVHKRLRKAPSALALDDIDAPLVMAFLDEMERARGITARTRNLRLTAVHSFFRFAAFEAPTHSAQIQRVLAIPAKRFTRTLVPFLSRQEVDALLAAPDQRSWSGRRDHALLLLAVQTGLRLSELTSLRHEDSARRHRCPRSRHRQGTQGAVHAAEQEHARRAGRVGARTAAGREPAAVPQRPRRQAEFPRRALPAEQARHDGRCEVPITEEQTCEPARAAPHDGDGSSSRGG